MTERDDLLRDIEIHRTRTLAVLGAAAVVVERSNRLSEDILRDLEESQPETEKALRVLRRAGLL